MRHRARNKQNNNKKGLICQGKIRIGMWKNALHIGSGSDRRTMEMAAQVRTADAMNLVALKIKADRPSGANGPIIQIGMMIAELRDRVMEAEVRNAKSLAGSKVKGGPPGHKSEVPVSHMMRNEVPRVRGDETKIGNPTPRAV